MRFQLRFSLLKVLFCAAIVLLLPGAVRADDSTVCGSDDASDAASMAACSRIIGRYRPSGGGSASGAIAYNSVQIAYISRIELYDRAGKFDLALKDAETAIRLGQNDPMVVYFYSTRADILMKLRNFDRATAGLTSAIAQKPKYAAALYGIRARVWVTKGDPDRALADATEAIRLDPDDVGRYGTRASIFHEKGEFDRALADYNEAIRRKPDDANGYLHRGGYLAERGMFEEAKADFAEAIRRAPDSGGPWGYRALMWRDLGEYDQALADYEEAIKRFPKNGVIRSSRGEIWRLKGDLDRALDDQNAGLKLYPREGVIFILRGDTLRYRGDLKAAIADYDAALRQSVSFTIPSATGRGLAYEKMGDFGRAGKEFEAAVKYGSGRVLVDMDKSRFETAQARLVALNSGAPQPVIAAVPAKSTTATSIPTRPAVVAATSLPLSQGPNNASPTIAPGPSTSSSPQGRRVALVIGNAAYKSVPALTNPHKDAEAVAASLRNIGFETVTLAADATREKLIDALRAFADEAEKADWAMVYYAGHGIEVNGLNYLIPVDAKLEADRDVQFEAVPLEQVLAALEGARKIKLVMLDACRDNPFAPQMRKTTAPEAMASTQPPAARSLPARSAADSAK